MAASFVKIKDTISPDLLRMAKAASDPKPMLEAMGTAVVSMAQRAFTDDGLRPSMWAKRKVEPKDGHALLIKSGRLRKSIRISSVTNWEVTISSEPRPSPSGSTAARTIPTRVGENAGLFGCG